MNESEPLHKPKLALPIDFAPLNEILPGKVSFSDIDGVCERNGHLLLLEFKGDGKLLSEGQKLLYLRLLLQSGGYSRLLLCYHDVPSPGVETLSVDGVIGFHVIRVRRGPNPVIYSEAEVKEDAAARLRQYVAIWFTKANG